MKRALAVAAVLCCGWALGVMPDVLEQPARFSARASSSVLLGITRAGGRLVTVGEGGLVLYSDDAARSWRQAAVPVSTTLTAVHFANEKQGWAVGHSGAVVHTEDGGASWVKQLDGNAAARLVLDDVQKRAAGRDDLEARRQLDDAQRLVDEGPDKPFLDVWFASEKRGFIVGAYGLFFATQDGGRTWLPAHTRLDNPKGRHLYSIKADGASVYIAGEGGVLYRSTDSGASFAAVPTPYHGSYFGVLPFDGKRVLVFGLRGHAYLSNDAGGHWRKIDTATEAALTAGVRLGNGSIVLASQAGDLWRSSDHGRSFQALQARQRQPFSAVAEAADASLVLSSNRGVIRLLPP
jgi:photosystem II stability/assembly factor-like uncharacterized protein